jgi:hypothetical protein
MAARLPERKASYYDILGVPRDAKLTDITRAYNRLRAEVTRPDQPPDLKRETMIREAYETLSDAGRRDAYDATLVAPDRRHRSRMRGIVIGAVGVALAGGYFLYKWQEAPPPSGPVRSAQEIQGDTALSAGRLSSIDISGRSVPVGVAFAIGDRMLVSSCRGVSPAAQLVVNMPPRTIPVRIFSVDEQFGVCRLVSEGSAGRPLEPAPEPKTGSLVYVLKVGNTGLVGVTQSTVKRVLFEPPAKVIEVAADGTAGAPLLDGQGQVVAVATGSDGRFVSIPPVWLTEAREPFKEAKPPVATAPPEAPAPGTAATPGRVPKSVEDIPPERREKLEKAFNPPTKLEEEIGKMK